MMQAKAEPVQASVSVEVAIERPFRMACRLQTPPGLVVLLPPGGPNQDAGALPLLVRPQDLAYCVLPESVDLSALKFCMSF